MRDGLPLVAAAALLIGWAGPALAQQPGPYHPMMWNGGWPMMFFGPLMMLIFIAAIVVLAVFAIRWLGSGGVGGFADRPGGQQRTPLDILQERLAKGEIDVAEYEERRRALESRR